MAGGWARDGAVSEQIEASINDELARFKTRRGPVGESSAKVCADGRRIADQQQPERESHHM